MYYSFPLCLFLSDEASARQWVEDNEKLIIDTVDSFDVRPYLFEKGVISITEYEEIMCRRDTCQPLIDLLRNHEPKKDLPFSHLMRAMRERHADFVNFINSTQLSKFVLFSLAKDSVIICYK